MKKSNRSGSRFRKYDFKTILKSTPGGMWDWKVLSFGQIAGKGTERKNKEARKKASDCREQYAKKNGGLGVFA